MKAWPVLLLTLLAGCGDAPHGLDAYMMRGSDAPGACYHVDPDDDEWRQAAGFVGWTKNPGPVDAHLLHLDGVVPDDTRVAVFECKFSDGYHQFVSAAVSFASPEDAATWIAAAQAEQQAFMPTRCHPQALVFSGDVVGGIGAIDAWHPEFQAAAEARFAEVVARPDVVDHCV